MVQTPFTSIRLINLLAQIEPILGSLPLAHGNVIVDMRRVHQVVLGDCRPTQCQVVEGELSDDGGYM